jgi:hypothetical protein
MNGASKEWGFKITRALFLSSNSKSVVGFYVKLKGWMLEPTLNFKNIIPFQAQYCASHKTRTMKIMSIEIRHRNSKNKRKKSEKLLQ